MTNDKALQQNSVAQEVATHIFEGLDLTDATRADYTYRVGGFLTFIADKGGLSPNSYLDYKRYLLERNDISISTKNKYLTSARILLKELNRLGKLPVDITQNIKAFRQNRLHKREGLNDKEMDKLTAKVRELPLSAENSRLRAILALLTLQGLRQIEVCRLDITDLDLANRRAFVLGKGRDDKEPIALHPETIRALMDYIRTNKIKSGALFVSRSNRGLNTRLTTRSVRRIVKDFLLALGIEDKTTHGFRHYFTTTLLRTYGGDLLEVSRYTRHKSLETLQVYNDNIKREADLPRFYEAFNAVKL